MTSSPVPLSKYRLTSLCPLHATLTTAGRPRTLASPRVCSVYALSLSSGTRVWTYSACSSSFRSPSSSPLSSVVSRHAQPRLVAVEDDEHSQVLALDRRLDFYLHLPGHLGCDLARQRHGGAANSPVPLNRAFVVRSLASLFAAGRLDRLLDHGPVLVLRRGAGRRGPGRYTPLPTQIVRLAHGHTSFVGTGR